MSQKIEKWVELNKSAAASVKCKGCESEKEQEREIEFRVELIIGSDSKGWESEKEQERGLKFRVELIIGSDSKGRSLLLLAIYR